jgi:hypothetical protein
LQQTRRKMATDEARAASNQSGHRGTIIQAKDTGARIIA